MVQINFAQKTINVKIVYYGPGMSGKTTNIEIVHQRAPDQNRGDLTSISTDGDRTLFFDYMPLDLGTVAGMRTSFQIYTVPGQVYYNSTRKLVLQGVDGVVFVADSSASMLQENLESLRNLEENLNEYGKSLATIPHVMQWNKRDLPDAMSVDELERHMNRHGGASFEAVASTGQGVFPTLKALASSVLKSIMRETTSGGAGSAPSAAAPVPTAAPLATAPAPMVQHAPLEPAPQPVAPPPLDLAGAPAPQPLAAQLPQQAPMEAHAPVVQQVAPPPAPVQAPAPATAGSVLAQAAPVQAPRPVAPARRPATRRPAPAPQQVARSRGDGLKTGIFVVLAMAVGAALAWVVLTVL